MNAKEIVLQKYTKARIDKVKSGKIKGFQKTIWYVRPKPGEMYISFSYESENDAWKKAKEQIVLLSASTIVS